MCFVYAEDYTTVEEKVPRPIVPGPAVPILPPHNSHHETNVMAGSTERGERRGHGPTPTGRLTASSPRSLHRSGFFGTGRRSSSISLHIVILYEIEAAWDERVKNEATDDMIKIARFIGLMCMIDTARRKN